MSLLDRYLAREILLPLAAGLLFLTQLLLATQILAQASVLFGAGVSLADVGLVISLPAALLRASSCRWRSCWAWCWGWHGWPTTARWSPWARPASRRCACCGSRSCSRWRGGPGLWMALSPSSRPGCAARVPRTTSSRGTSPARYGRGRSTSRSPASRSTPSRSTARAGATSSSRTVPIRTPRSWPSRAAASSSRWGRGRTCSSVSRTASCTARTSSPRTTRSRSSTAPRWCSGWAPRAPSGLGRNAREMTLARPGSASRRRTRRGSRSRPGTSRATCTAESRGRWWWSPSRCWGYPSAPRRVGRAFGVGATLLTMVAHYILLRAGEMLVQKGAPPAGLAQLPTGGGRRGGARPVALWPGAGRGGAVILFRYVATRTPGPSWRRWSGW